MSKSGISELLNQIRTLIINARSAVAKSADFVQVWTNFQTGRLIVEDEQDGAKRAAYAEKTIVELSKRLSAEFGRGFAKRNLEYMRQFYQMYSPRIAQSPIAQSSLADTNYTCPARRNCGNKLPRFMLIPRKTDNDSLVQKWFEGRSVLISFCQ
jgi:hypothetical protein